MENIGLIIGIIAGLIAIAGTLIAWSKMCEGHQEEFLIFNVNFAQPLTEHLTKIGKTRYISEEKTRYKLTEIKALNADIEIMEGLREDLVGIYLSIRQLCSWRSWFCREK